MNNKEATLALGTRPIGRLLLSYAMPAVIAMTAVSLYNMVDSVFIGHGVGTMAISGLAITFPFMNLSAAFGAAIGIGSSTLLSLKLGQKDYETAQKILGSAVILTLIIGTCFGLLSLIFIKPILCFFGASAGTLPYGVKYMSVILLGAGVSHLYFALNALLRAIGKPKLAMISTFLTVVLNTILDPIFIWPLHMGIRGAAYATVLSQLLALCWQLYLFSNKKSIVYFSKNIFKIFPEIIKRIIGIGISPFIINSCACIVVILINNGLVKYGGDLAVGAYGIANRVAFLFIMVVFGINQGMQPIAGYNYGAQNMGRVTQVLKYAILAAIVVMSIGFIIAHLFANQCVSMFTSDSQLMSVAERAIRILMTMFPLVGIQIVITNFFQSIGKAKISIFLSLSRQLLFLIPLLIILPYFLAVDGIWYSLPISDTVASCIAIGMLCYYYKKNNS